MLSNNETLRMQFLIKETGRLTYSIRGAVENKEWAIVELLARQLKESENEQRALFFKARRGTEASAL